MLVYENNKIYKNNCTKKMEKNIKKILAFFERWVIIDEMKNKGEKKNVSIY